MNLLVGLFTFCILSESEIIKLIRNIAYIGNWDYPIGHKCREQFLAMLNI